MCKNKVHVRFTIIFSPKINDTYHFQQHFLNKSMLHKSVPTLWLYYDSSNASILEIAVSFSFGFGETEAVGCMSDSTSSMSAVK